MNTEDKKSPNAGELKKKVSKKIMKKKILSTTQSTERTESVKRKAEEMEVDSSTNEVRTF